MNAFMASPVTRFLIIATLLAVCFVVSGCQSLIPNQGYDAHLSTGQLKAIVADKNAAVVCSQIPTPLGPAKIVVVNLDQRTIDNGGITTTSDCQVTITTIKPLPPPKEPK